MLNKLYNGRDRRMEFIILITSNYFEHLLCIKHSSQHFIHMHTFHSHTKPVSSHSQFPHFTGNKMNAQRRWEISYGYRANKHWWQDSTPGST